MRRWREIVVCDRCGHADVGQDFPDHVPLPRLRSVYLWRDDEQGFYRCEDNAFCHAYAGVVLKALTIAKPGNGA